MKKIFLLLCVTALLSSCATIKLPTTTEPATVVFTDSNMCVEKPFSASINEDSLIEIAGKGFVLQSGAGNIKIYWQTVGVSDPFNGQLVIEPNLCINGTDFCIIGQYFIRVRQNSLTDMLKQGMTFGTSSVSIFVYYYNERLTAIPKVCIKTAQTSAVAKYKSLKK